MAAPYPWCVPEWKKLWNLLSWLPGSLPVSHFESTSHHLKYQSFLLTYYMEILTVLLPFGSTWAPESKSTFPHSSVLHTECWLPFWPLENYVTSEPHVFYQQNGMIIDEQHRMCSDQHISTHCTLTALTANSNKSTDGSFISIDIITHNSNSGTILHFFPHYSVVWNKSLGIGVNFVFNNPQVWERAWV